MLSSIIAIAQEAKTSARLVIMASLLLVMASCSSDSGKFRIEGRLRHLNQGEFLVYSTDGAILGIDTLRVRDGRFNYERDLLAEGTLVIVFPNQSEQAVFAKPGAVVKIKGDATHLKEMIVRGTDDNNDYTELRQQLNDLVPPDVPVAVEQFIIEHPRSAVSRYLLTRHFVQSTPPNYAKASALTALMLQSSPDDSLLKRQHEVYTALKRNSKGLQLPTFSATDINGRRVTQTALKKKLNIVNVWATWNYTSTDFVRRMRKLQKKHPDDLAMLSICVDARADDCRRRVERDSLLWSNVCDGKMFRSPLLSRLGLPLATSNILVDSRGRIIEKNILPAKLEEVVEKHLKGNTKH